MAKRCKRDAYWTVVTRHGSYRKCKQHAESTLGVTSMREGVS